ncbi:SDR family NAD(P)-dependent oxidoreductase [Aquihabitans daechungensis]|uniref:SDR family NAD(P)-dependent oxidoreductase n=1 Tax=Aquihabitans daechungensis TaxID=1052257 RepID=UPI003BA1C832
MSHPVPFDLDPELLHGKVVAITGGLRGLGAGMAARFGELGMHVAVGGRSVIHVPDSVEEGLGAHLDVTEPESIEQFANLTEGELGPINLWVNNAGVLDPMGRARDADPDEVARALAVNVGGVVNGSAVFARRAGRWAPARRVLVNISSGASTSIYEGWSVYGATKAAVDHFTEILDVEEPDLACFAVAPGVVDTDMQAQIRTHDESTFPAIERFRQLHETGAWNSPAWVADHLAGLLTGALAPGQVVYRVPDEPRS